MKKFHRGLTMVELMVAVFILSLILIMGAGASSFMVGKLRSAKSAKLAEVTRNAFDIISQKMNTANARSGSIYGFGEIGEILAIANKTGSDTKCTYIGKDGDSLKMIQSACVAPVSMATGQILIGGDVVVDSFIISGSGSFMTNSTPAQIPYANITIIAHDKNDPANKITLQTAYFLDYQTVNNLK